MLVSKTGNDLEHRHASIPARTSWQTPERVFTAKMKEFPNVTMVSLGLDDFGGEESPVQGVAGAISGGSGYWPIASNRPGCESGAYLAQMDVSVQRSKTWPRRRPNASRQH
ncbi:protein of unknown function [Aminobacter niigataensis]|nr:protein of unknown function [Aminobacter niigataensis]